jgi:hypothetical protein
MRNRFPILVLAAVVAAGAPLAADAKGKGKGKGKPGTASSASSLAPGHGAVAPGRGGTPPGLAKKGGLPPGLAKKLGRPVPERIYVAFDPRREDRAWFLIENRWVMRTDFDPALRLEVRRSLLLPPIPRPPLPPPLEHLHVVLFGS